MLHTTELNVGWGAGRYNTGALAVAGYLDDNAFQHDLDLILVDEAQQRRIRRVVRRVFGRDWATWKRGEYMAIWRRAVLKRRTLLPATIWHLTAIVSLVEWREMRAAVFRLWIKELGVPLNAMGSHAPSGVQAGEHWDTEHPRQVEASKTGHRRLGNRIARKADRHPLLVQLLGEDTNFDHLVKEWRDWYAEQVAPTVYAHGHLPDEGSHGSRLIDVIVVVGGQRIRIEVLAAGVSHVPRPPGYDHDLVWTRIRITVEAA